MPDMQNTSALLANTSPESFARKNSTIDAKRALKTVFGYDEFRTSQANIIDNVLHGQNTFAIMPTGGGKSLCYQIPAIVLNKLTVVISPLISLMQDQVRQLRELDVNAAFLNSTLSAQAYQDNIEDIQNGKCKLLFLAPETALQSSIIQVLQSANVACIAIDEAHCISEWGHEFRPEYRQLNTFIEQLPDVVVIALTATATPRVRNDIKSQLGIGEQSEFIASFDRPNLFIEVAPKESAYIQTKAYIDKHPDQSGIIYCQSRAGVDELYERLKRDGYSVLPYHAGLSSQARSQHQEEFVCDDVNIIVATVAFGMGINKPDVRFVVHFDLPKNIESYYQQIGRAGRDGIDANCLLLFSYGDTGKIRYFIDQMVNEQEKRLANIHLGHMLALVETEDCRRLPLLKYFGESDISERCEKCDNCVGDKKEKSDLTVPAQKFLSCVHRTKQIFGASHIIDVLRGSNAEKVLSNQHNLLSTYNIGKELSKKQWMTLSRQLIQKGLLRQDDKFGSLKLTQQAVDVLKGNAPFFAILQHDFSTQAKSSTSKNASMVKGDQQLVQILKHTRKQIADNAKLPPYAIFPDRSLEEMAYYLPHSELSMLKIHGVGQGKLAKYGERFTQLIIDYCDANELSEKENSRPASSAKANVSGGEAKQATAAALSQKSIDIATQFDQGLSISDLSTKHKVKDNTIYTHLYKCALNKHKVADVERLKSVLVLEDAVINEALIAFGEHGHERLKPIFDALQERISYEALHLLRILFLQNKLN